MLFEIFVVVLLLLIFSETFLILKKLFTMSATDDKIEGDVSRLRSDLAAFSAKLTAIATDPSNTLSDQSASDLESITTALDALAGTTPPAATNA